MASGIRMTITSNRLPRLARSAPQLAAAGVRETLDQVVAGAKVRSRVDTGEMRAGWTSRMTGPAEGEVVNEVEHTVYNEFGTRYMPAQPMLRPALDAARPGFADAMRRMLRDL